MKTFRTIVIAAALMTAGVCAFAQPKQGKQDKNEWMEKMKAEKIAFITTELNLSAEEAQTFWPVYNKVEADKAEAMKAAMKANKELSKAVREGSGNYTALLDAAAEAHANAEKANAQAAKELRKSLGDEMTAKLIVAEEKYRRFQLQRLNGQGHGQPGHPQGGQPGCGQCADGKGRPEGGQGFRPGEQPDGQARGQRGPRPAQGQGRPEATERPRE